MKTKSKFLILYIKRNSNELYFNSTLLFTGVIFDENSDALERAVNYGVEVANSTDSQIKIYAIRNETDISNSFKLGYTSKFSNEALC